MGDFPTLYTPRLTLRAMTLADAERVHELAGDARIAATTARIPHPYPAEEAAKYIETLAPQAAAGKQYTFAITLAGTRTPGREHDLLDTGHLIGSISLREIEEQHKRGVMGYWIGVPYWNKGFATEASRALLAFAFTRKGLNRVTADHFVFNPASGRVLQKIGMTQEGVLRQFCWKDGAFRDVAVFGILQEDWIRQRKTSKLRADAKLQAV
jgi:RimJ/RimL family protein N-acetyltransferase